ncbi:MAG: dephospho-CoA kinase [Kineosporiaceae bacterium]|nr:dephospho-CoA kinase [Kineosporiaceae bacterium]
MLRVGLTGGIGAGKSTVARRLLELGAVVVDADQVARQVVAPGSPGLAEVVAAFGPQLISASGELDRAGLARIVFTDVAARRRLEAITHPRIAETTARIFAEVPGDSVGVHDLPLLVETDAGARYHLVIVVHAEVEERIRRLVTDRGMSVAEARSRIAAQAGDIARRAVADIWLDNTRGSADLLELVDTAWHRRISPFATNLAMNRPAAGRGGIPDEAARARLGARLRAATGPDAVISPTSAGFEISTGPVARPALPAAVVSAGYAPSDAPSEGGLLRTCDPAWAGLTVRISS